MFTGNVRAGEQGTEFMIEIEDNDFDKNSSQEIAAKPADAASSEG